MAEEMYNLKKEENSITHVIKIDSSYRDKVAYPDASNYQVFFEEPFENVYSLEVISASVPRTMNIIDIDNNSLFYNINNTQYNQYLIDIGDHTLDNIASAMNNQMSQQIQILDSTNNQSNNYETAQIQVSAMSQPMQFKSRIIFSCKYPFVLDMGQSTSYQALGFGNYAQADPNLQKTQNQGQWIQDYNYMGDDNRQLFASVQGTDTSNQIFLQNPRPSTEQYFNQNQIYAQKFYSSETQTLTSISLYFDTQGTVANLSNIVQIQLYAHNSISDEPLSSATSSYLASTQTLMSLFKTQLTTITFNLNDVNEKLNLQPNTYYWIVISNTNQAQTDQSGYYLYTQTTSTQDINYYTINNHGTLTSTDNGVTWTSLNGDYNLQQNQFFINQIAMQINTTKPYHYINSPGLVQLTGDQYVYIKCPEIESHMFDAFLQDQNKFGLGVVQLGVNGFSENRFDFTNVNSRSFHPMGKLQKITLTFIKPNGNIYNFKGLNHTLLLHLKQYSYNRAQKQQMDHPQISVLNPNYQYNQNLQAYIDNQMIAESEDSTSQSQPQDLEDQNEFDKKYLKAIQDSKQYQNNQFINMSEFDLSQDFNLEQQSDDSSEPQ